MFSTGRIVRKLSRSPRSECKCNRREPIDVPHNVLDGDEDMAKANGDRNLWSFPLGDFNGGQYSFASVCCRPNPEARAQIDNTMSGVFAGIYDGHCGAAASEYILGNLVTHLMASARAHAGSMSELILEEAISQTEDAFRDHVITSCNETPSNLKTGSCCLAAIIWNRMLYVANLGDSRAVLGFYNSMDQISDKQLTNDHNVRSRTIRKQLKREHPRDKHIVEKVGGSRLVKGQIEVTRTIGDLYLKDPSRQFIPGEPKLDLSQQISSAVIRSNAEMHSKSLANEDKFLIFASEGFWAYLDNQEAVEIVHGNIRRGSAKRLLIKALLSVADKKKHSYQVWKKTRYRPDIHKDMSVIVVFIGNEENPAEAQNIPDFLPLINEGESVIAFQDGIIPSEFGTLIVGVDNAIEDNDDNNQDEADNQDEVNNPEEPGNGALHQDHQDEVNNAEEPGNEDEEDNHQGEVNNAEEPGNEALHQDEEDNHQGEVNNAEEPEALHQDEEDNHQEEPGNQDEEDNHQGEVNNADEVNNAEEPGNGAPHNNEVGSSSSAGVEEKHVVFEEP